MRGQIKLIIILICLIGILFLSFIPLKKSSLGQIVYVENEAIISYIDEIGGSYTTTSTVKTPIQIIAPKITSITPISGSIGSIVTIKGEGFMATETIRIDFGTIKTISIITTTANGTFHTTFTINPQPLGLKIITATGISSNMIATATFTLVAGALTYLQIETLSGLKINHASMVLGEELRVILQGYDAWNNLISMLRGEWNVSNGIGTITPIGTISTFKATAIGTGSIMAKYATYTATIRIEVISSEEEKIISEGSGVIIKLPKINIAIDEEAISEDGKLTISTVSAVLPTPSELISIGKAVKLEFTHGTLTISSTRTITLKIYYSNNDLNLISTGIDEDTLAIYCCDETYNWRYIGGERGVDEQGCKYIATTLKNFSIYALLGKVFVINKNIEKSYCYPNPFKPNSGLGHKFITFIGQTPFTNIKVYNLTGELVKEIKTPTNDDKWIWDGKNDTGIPVSSGIYLYVITYNNGDRERIGKVCIIR